MVTKAVVMRSWYRDSDSSEPRRELGEKRQGRGLSDLGRHTGKT